MEERLISEESFRPLGKTGIMVSPFCYGCASAFARTLISDEEAIALFKSAYDRGVRFFDTGHSYGCAEERIGKALKAHPEIKREEIVISTKFGTRVVDGNYRHDVSPEWIRESVALSLERMGIDYIDVLYVHGPQIADLSPEFFACLQELKEQGKIRAIGANTFNDKVIRYIAKEKCMDAVMLDYNVVRQDREPLIEELYENGIAVVAGQALAEGLFSRDLFKVRSKKDIWYLARTFGRKSSRKLYFKAGKFRFLNRLEGLDGSQVAMKYVLDNPKVASLAFGTVSPEHLKKNLSCISVEIPEEVLKRIKNA